MQSFKYNYMSYVNGTIIDRDFVTVIYRLYVIESLFANFKDSLSTIKFTVIESLVIPSHCNPL